MDTDTLLSAVEREGRALAAAGRAGLDAPVPSCPGWGVADVVGHMARVFRSIAEHVERRAQEMVPAGEIPEPPEGDALLGFYEEGLDRVLAALRGIGPDEPVWSWSGHNVGGFYHRRAAHETAVHRWDAESAHGTPGPFDGDLAADGVSEFYERVLPFSIRRWKRTPPQGSLHLHRTDGPGEWMVRVDDGEVLLTHEHGKGDAAVRGPAGELLLLAWHRRGLDGLEVFGDPEVASAWASLAP
jgi:uncharacterized protein (TIGR03083 family)